ncbi:uncharacterized protein LOC144107660 isoform X2 [Amblyomma americanum]
MDQVSQGHHGGRSELVRHLMPKATAENSIALEQSDFVNPGEELRRKWQGAGHPDSSTVHQQPPQQEQSSAVAVRFLKRRWPCHLCPIVCSTEFNLSNHMRRHAARKRHACPVCPITCSTEFNLANHMRTHTGEKPFKCEVCPMAFAAKGTLVNHMRTHTGERPFQCTFCNKRFTRKFVLRDHINYRHAAESSLPS